MMEDQSQLAQADINMMSDEELSNLDLSQLNVVDEPDVEESQPEATSTDANVDNASQDAEVEDESQTTAQPFTDNPDTAATQDNARSADGQKPDDSQAQESESEVDYKAFYEQVTGTFKANGRDLSITDPNDIVSMMQRGAGFAKKMATLKPSMRILRTLENHDISEEQLGFLIDLHNKNPEAIGKLVKESGVDVYSFDAEKADDYRTQAAIATDSEVELDSVVRELSESSPTFPKTLDTVVNKWDAVSHQAVAQHPQLLQMLDTHMQLGYFDQVTNEVERLRAIGGHIDGLSDFDAYRTVGDAMNAQGVFNRPNNGSTPSAQAAPTTQLAAPPSRNPGNVNAKRRAASSPRPSATTQPQNVNYDAMSDDELVAALSRH